jgi:hypothetical protein
MIETCLLVRDRGIPKALIDLQGGNTHTADELVRVEPVFTIARVCARLFDRLYADPSPWI